MIGLPNCKQREPSLQRHEHQARPRAVAALRGCLHSIGLSHLQRPLANKHPNATAGQFLSKRLFCSHFSNPLHTYFLDKNQTLKPLIFSLEGTETCRNNKNRKLTNIFNDGIKTRFDKEKLICAQTSNSTANNGQRETQKFTEDATNSNRHQ